MFLDRVPETWSLASQAQRLLLVPVERFDVRASVPLEYAARVPATDRRAVHVRTDARTLAALADEWMGSALSWPLHVLDDDGGVSRTIATVVERELASRFDEVVVLVGRVELRRRVHRLMHDRSADAIGRLVAGIPRARVAVITVGTT